jgi:hypothetical protein
MSELRMPRVLARLIPTTAHRPAVESPFGGGRGVTTLPTHYHFEAENAFLMGPRKTGMERLVALSRDGWSGATGRAIAEIIRDYDPTIDRLLTALERAAIAEVVRTGDPSLLPGYRVELDATVVMGYVTTRLYWRLPPDVIEALSLG